MVQYVKLCLACLAGISERLAYLFLEEEREMMKFTFARLLISSLLLICAACKVEAVPEKDSEGRNTTTIPEIFIIGAAKCGTTSLHELLSKHPDICDSGIKEKHFFDEIPRIFRMQPNILAKYQDLFQSKQSENDNRHSKCKFYIDSTPAYIRSPNAIANMNETFSPQLMATKKFILILREPTARECSWYQHFARGCLDHLETRMKELAPNGDKGGWKRSICHGSHGRYCDKLSCLDHNEGDITKDNYIQSIDNFSEYLAKAGGSSSLYDVQIARWLKFVRRDQIFIISMDDLIFKTALIMTRLTKFLKLSRGFGEDVTLPDNNVNKVKDLIPCDCATFDKLKEEYDGLRTVENLLALINSPFKHPAEPDFTPFQYKRKCTD